MTYLEHCREIARQESMALRAWARQGRLPKHAPTDFGDFDQRRALHCVRLGPTSPRRTLT